VESHEECKNQRATYYINQTSNLNRSWTYIREMQYRCDHIKKFNKPCNHPYTIQISQHTPFSINPCLSTVLHLAREPHINIKNYDERSIHNHINRYSVARIALWQIFSTLLFLSFSTRPSLYFHSCLDYQFSLGGSTFFLVQLLLSLGCHYSSLLSCGCFLSLFLHN